ncbi:MAG: aminotransferase class V-fold PLP-dependent enzyme [Vicinamibacterales bacterium]|jgi:L-seryl-tRNA(Ser) seleniumtransferase|nr:hypothetical protein [Acidobacteriota bacterium]MDP6371552.1 aminotransferase class V-fold PLP-dependent enzyme [Vicinamibacterales bacterium]|tara:strand:- start:6152 stop:7717 length:1566 start_codon:yes stop_codon:yes gene_type:complete
MSNSTRGRITRRDLFRSSSAAATAALLGGRSQAAGATQASSGASPEVYTRLGVEPFINCTATLTINGGSRLLPEVVDAIEQASHFHVDLDELLEAAGRRIAELLEVEWALVTSGAASALTHATAGCVAGTDPELMQQLPDVTGLKDEVVIPRTSRNSYDHAIRTVGVRIVEVDSIAEMEAAMTERTAMVAVLGNRFEEMRLGLTTIAPIARAAGVPILVDAAADYPVMPNPYIRDGADLVAYSCGKILRGPQTAGLLLGRQDLVRAAGANAAPHHAIGRPMKVSKEEIVGAVTAVEAWMARDLASEYREWESWYARISERIAQVAGVSARIEPPTRGGPFPTLLVEWDPAQIPITAEELNTALRSGRPAIATHAAGPGHSCRLRPAAMRPEDHLVVAERLHELFSQVEKVDRRPATAAPAADLSGRWDVDVTFGHGRAEHVLFLEARDHAIAGTHVGTRIRGELSGRIEGAHVHFRSELPFEGVRLGYEFDGTVAGDEMSGTLDLGEYPAARWTARRHTYA